MKKLFFFLVVSFTLSLAVSCTRHHIIESRAHSQVEPSLVRELEDFVPTAANIRCLDAETVYANDTICILQLTANYDTAQQKNILEEVQYVYYVDMLLSRYYGKPIYREEFRNVPPMTRKEIKDSARKVRRTGENVYNSFAGHGNVITENFDDGKE